MKRRDFLKLIGVSILSSVVVVKSKLLPSRQDYIYAELQKHADYSTQSAPFIQFWDVWFFADADIIKYCPVSELRWDNWSTLRIQNCPDVFDYWQKIEGKFYWVGKRNRWEVLPDILDRRLFKIQWCGYWDGENWNVK